MDCPHLEGKHINYCSAYHKLMVPSIDEIDTFCSTGEYESCPIFRAYCLRSCSMEKEETNESAYA